MIGRGGAFFSALDGYATARMRSATASGSVRNGEWSLSQAVRGARVRGHRLLRRYRDRVVEIADDVGRRHVAPADRAHGLHERGDRLRAQLRGGGVGDLRRARVVEDLLRALDAHRLAVGVRDLPRGRRAAGDVRERLALVEHEGRQVDEVTHALGAGGGLGDDDAAVGVADDDLVARGVVEHLAHGAGVVVEVAAGDHARQVDRHDVEAVAAQAADHLVPAPGAVPGAVDEHHGRLLRHGAHPKTGFDGGATGRR